MPSCASILSGCDRSSRRSWEPSWRRRRVSVRVYWYSLTEITLTLTTTAYNGHGESRELDSTVLDRRRLPHRFCYLFHFCHRGVDLLRSLSILFSQCVNVVVICSTGASSLSGQNSMSTCSLCRTPTPTSYY